MAGRPPESTMWLHVNPSYRDLLERNGFRELSDFFDYRGGTLTKNLPDRSLTRLTLASTDRTQTFFLKRHFGRMRAADRFRNRLSGFHGSWGRKELDAIEAFRMAGIPTLQPVASGEEPVDGGFRSFLMTEELTGFQPVDRFVRSRFAPPLDGLKLREKREMIKEVAGIARRMHRMGFNHRDFYCCHLFVRMDKDRRELRVLDLQRVDRRRWLRSRWIVKDLAALYYSAPRPHVTHTDDLRFLVHYFGSAGRARAAGRLLRQIARKAERIRRHDRKLQARRSAATSRSSDIP